MYWIWPPVIWILYKAIAMPSVVAVSLGIVAAGGVATDAGAIVWDVVVAESMGEEVKRSSKLKLEPFCKSEMSGLTR